MGGQGDCELRIEVFEKIHTKKSGAGVVRVGGSGWMWHRIEVFVGGGVVGSGLGGSGWM